MWSITVLNLSHSCSESPWDCLCFDFKTASLQAARRGEAVTQTHMAALCPPVPWHQAIKGRREPGAVLGLVPMKLLLYKPPHSTEGISEVVLIPADDNPT